MRTPLIAFSALAVVAAGTFVIAPAQADQPDWEVVASGLNNPRQLSLGPEGGLFIAQAGNGDPTGTLCDGPGPDASCIGDTGEISFVENPRGAVPELSTIADGLASGAGRDGSFAVGSDGVSWTSPGKIYAQITYAPPDVLPVPLKKQAGQLLRINRATGDYAAAANITKFELQHNPDGQQVDSNPYAVLGLPNHDLLVADAAGNDVLRVTSSGHVSLFHVFADVGRHDYVPTSLARDSHGNIYVGGLVGEAPNKGQVTKLSPTGDVLRVWRHFTTVTGVAVGSDGSLFVSELFVGFDPTDPNLDPSQVGQVTHVAPDGDRTSTTVPFPAGIVVDNKGWVFVSAWSIAPEDGAFGNPDWNGQVWRMKL